MRYKTARREMAMEQLVDEALPLHNRRQQEEILRHAKFGAFAPTKRFDLRVCAFGGGRIGQNKCPIAQ